MVNVLNLSPGEAVTDVNTRVTCKAGNDKVTVEKAHKIRAYVQQDGETLYGSWSKAKISKKIK